MSSAFNELHAGGRLTPEQAMAAYVNMPESYRSWVSENTFVSYFTASNRQSILWHDYEGGGTHAASTQSLQFAAIRTDLNHCYLDEPTDIYCKLAGDKLPHPVAIALTKINPMHCMAVGHPEPLFFRMILQEMSVSGTCSTGYNSMGYDEEMTRFGLWRNLLPVYNREFEFGCSRWDLLTVVAAYSALNIQGIEWPVTEDGRRTIKLERLAQSNKIVQESAHNALDDVKALIGLSKKLQECNPILWASLFENRNKRNSSLPFKTGNRGLFISSRIGPDTNYSSPAMVLGPVPGESNKVAVVQLDQLDALRECWRDGVEDIRRKRFATRETLEAAGEHRPPLQVVALNKSPIFFGEAYLHMHMPSAWSEQYTELANKITSQPQFLAKLLSSLSSDEYEPVTNPELALYQAGFPSDKDKKTIALLATEKLEQAFGTPPEWDNPIYGELWQRARCKLNGYPGVNLSDDELSQWQAYCVSELTKELPEGGKHAVVNLNAVYDVLSETDMPGELSEGYHSWLRLLRTGLGSHFPLPVPTEEIVPAP